MSKAASHPSDAVGFADADEVATHEGKSGATPSAFSVSLTSVDLSHNRAQSAVYFSATASRLSPSTLRFIYAPGLRSRATAPAGLRVQDEKIVRQCTADSLDNP